VLSGRHANLNVYKGLAAGVLAVTVSVAALQSAHAQGFFDFLFGGFQQRPAQPQAPNSYPPPSPSLGRVAPAPLGPESVTENGGSTGHPVVYCVRLCDGQHFPMEHMVNGTPVETCRATCPYSKTKVFFGAEIGDAVAQDGQHYTDLDSAFAYRKQLVANCTCNGKDAFGLNKLDVRKDPTLRPGDIVATKEGLMAYTGRNGSDAGFSPVNPATLPDDIKPETSQLPPPSASQSTSNDDPGTVVQTPGRKSRTGASTTNTQDRSAK